MPACWRHEPGTNVRIALGIEYDGSSFCGWQTQPAGCAAQDKLEQALAQIAGERIATVCAGRTDAGVHALAQVVHFDTSVQRPESAWVRGVNALLPSAIAVTWAMQVNGEFHARYSARNRCYRYMLLNHPVRPAADRCRVGWFHMSLDLENMRAAARLLLGEHDFSAFRSSECQARSPVRELRRLDIERRGDYVIFDICANAFLYHMVRNIVGALIEIGRGARDRQWLQELIDSCDRSKAPAMASALGLYLVKVDYPAAFALPERAKGPLFIGLD